MNNSLINNFCLKKLPQDIYLINSILYAINSIENKNHDLVQRIRKWAVQYNISHRYANEILNIFRSTGIKVSKDIRTILQV